MSVLLQFSAFTDAQMIFISLILFATLFASVKIRSLVSIVAWTFTGIAVVGVMAFNLEIIYFWFMLIVQFVSLAIGMSVKTMYQAKI